MPLQATSGGATYDAYGGGVPVVPTYIEDVFSTWLYTGNGSTQTINNGIDLAGKGGLVWGKNRDANWGHYLADTAQGTGKFLSSDKTDATALDSTSITAFNSNGFSIGDAGAFINNNNVKYASWTFRKAKKFFDVVTYTGNGGDYTRRISHSLGSTPGFVIIKCTSSTGDWHVMATLSDGTQITGGGTGLSFGLNLTSSFSSSISPGSDLAVSSTSFAPVVISGFDVSQTNANGATYVAYLFAHNAGGFGLSGNENVISCGSVTTTSASYVDVNLGYEPQYVMIKATTISSGWEITDVMRGMTNDTSSVVLQANTSGSEFTASPSSIVPTATGFRVRSSAYWGSGVTLIYMAIRRPMKVPTTGTSVFSPVLAVNESTGTKITTNFAIDSQWQYFRTASTTNFTRTIFNDRLRRASTNSTDSGNRLISSSTGAEVTTDGITRGWDNTGFVVSSYWGGATVCYFNFRRASGFFDIVCYTGTGSPTNINHNLGVVPELIIVKDRSVTRNWVCYNSNIGYPNVLVLNSTGAAFSDTDIFGNTITSSVFRVQGDSTVNNGADNYVAYLFASVTGVSKVGSYTGTGTTQTINCGFSGGARFVLIKRTDSTGDWWVWDTARGMVSGTDPRLALNSTAAESNENWVYTTTGGFQIVTSDATINASGGSYIFLAIA